VHRADSTRRENACSFYLRTFERYLKKNCGRNRGDVIKSIGKAPISIGPVFGLLKSLAACGVHFTVKSYCLYWLHIGGTVVNPSLGFLALLLRLLRQRSSEGYGFVALICRKRTTSNARHAGEDSQRTEDCADPSCLSVSVACCQSGAHPFFQRMCLLAQRANLRLI